MQLTTILAVCIAMLAVETGSGDGSGGGEFWYAYFQGGTTVYFLAGTVLLLGSLMRLGARRLVRQMNETGHTAVLRKLGRIDFSVRLLILAVFGIQLTVGGWADLIYRQWGLTNWILVDEVLLMVPFVLLVGLQGYCMYPIHRKVRESVMVGHLARGLPVQPVWTRKEYLSFQLRSGVGIILVPVLLILAVRDVALWFVGVWPVEQITWLAKFPREVIAEGITGVGAMVIFLLSPELLRRIWVTRKLPDGPLRNRLKTLCQQVRLKYRDILFWDTYAMVANAAVMGLIRPVRYLLLSDGLIENTPDEQIEAVFGHEAGHVRHHHIFFLIVFVLGFSLTGFFLLELSGTFLFDETNRSQPIEDWFAYGGMAVLFVSFLLLFGWVSRRFERQADVYGAKVAGMPAVSDEGSQADRMVYGAHVMCQSLRRIAMLNGISIKSRSWRHSSIATRILFLRDLASRPEGVGAFTRRLWWIKMILLMNMAAGMAGWIVFNYTAGVEG